MGLAQVRLGLLRRVGRSAYRLAIPLEQVARPYRLGTEARAMSLPLRRSPELFDPTGARPDPSDVRARHLIVEPCPFLEAVEFVGAWHSRLPRCQHGPWQYAFRAHIGGHVYAVALWNNPSARMLPSHWLELRRMACSPDAPRNTASRFLGQMVACFKRECPERERCISYQDTTVHLGTIYKASGWKIGNVASPRVRDRSKPRAGTKRAYRSNLNGIETDASAKVRWEMPL